VDVHAVGTSWYTLPGTREEVPPRGNERKDSDVNQQSPTFGADIRPLFRDSDIEEMSWSFDLASYDEVRDNAEAIYERLSDGSMPCDDPWPDERVGTFRAWIDAGTPA
jgi:hypothetical protein